MFLCTCDPPGLPSLSCGPPRRSAGLTWASQTLSPHRRCCAARGSAGPSGPSRPCARACQAASSRWCCPCWLCPSPAARPCPRCGPPGRSSNPSHTPVARSSQDPPQCPKSWTQKQQSRRFILSCRRKEADTHYWKLSLNLGDQLLFLDLVANFLFLSQRWGPMMKTSTKGLKPCAFHFRSLAATTGLQVRHCYKKTKNKKELKKNQVGCDLQRLLTFHVNFVFTVRLRQNVHTHDHLANSVHPRCCKRRKYKRLCQCTSMHLGC